MLLMLAFKSEARRAASPMSEPALAFPSVTSRMFLFLPRLVSMPSPMFDLEPEPTVATLTGICCSSSACRPGTNEVSYSCIESDLSTIIVMLLSPKIFSFTLSIGPARAITSRRKIIVLLMNIRIL